MLCSPYGIRNTQKNTTITAMEPSWNVPSRDEKLEKQQLKSSWLSRDPFDIMLSAKGRYRQWTHSPSHDKTVGLLLVANGSPCFVAASPRHRRA